MGMVYIVIKIRVCYLVMTSEKKRERLEWMLNKVNKDTFSFGKNNIFTNGDRFYLNLLKNLKITKYLQKIMRTAKDYGKGMFCYKCTALTSPQHVIQSECTFAVRFLSSYFLPGNSFFWHRWK